MSCFQFALAKFKARHADIVKIPYDWTLYYLRTQALHAKISREELAWVLHSFNHKRGYKESRDEETQKDDEGRETFYHALVTAVTDTGENQRGKHVYNVTLQPEEEGANHHGGLVPPDGSAYVNGVVASYHIGSVS